MNAGLAWRLLNPESQESSFLPWDRNGAEFDEDGVCDEDFC